ncbi:MAG TPA: SMP-30/gluconolactonase/LRE family protein [Parafilimonas sp.]|nr:SMP-30/gluconolactonase/LRE family protein [Parafilimonas sp.]
MKKPMSLTIADISIFADGLDHPECIAIHPDGSVWAGGEAGQIYRIEADGSSMQEINNTHGFILGIAFSPDASWLAVCDLKNKCVWKLDIKTNQLTKFATGAEGENFNIPNYASFTRDGKLFVTESGAFRQITGKIFCFDENGKGSIWHHGPFNFANGLALDADEKFLYVVCTWLPGVERIAINEDGSAGEREVFCTLPQTCPDGIAFDEAGNLYIGCYAPGRIYKVSPGKEVSILVDDWEAHTISNPTNLAFGGKNFDELFTANLGRWHISKINPGVKGLKLACHK